MIRNSSTASPSHKLHIRDDLTLCHVARFARLLVANLSLAPERYEWVANALLESGIAPEPRRICNEAHRKLRSQSLDAVAEAIFDGLLLDGGVNDAVAAVLRGVLEEWSIPAPPLHLRPLELQYYVACLQGTTNLRYHECSARRTHIATCRDCEEAAEFILGVESRGDGA